jgi:hypothetical protein
MWGGYSNKSGLREGAGVTEIELCTCGELWVLRDHVKAHGGQVIQEMPVGIHSRKEAAASRNHKLFDPVLMVDFCGARKRTHRG